MVLTSKFAGGNNSGQGSVLLASLDFAVAPNAANQEALTAAYKESKPGSMGNLETYFNKHNMPMQAEGKPATAATAKAKPAGSF